MQDRKSAPSLPVEGDAWSAADTELAGEITFLLASPAVLSAHTFPQSIRPGFAPACSSNIQRTQPEGTHPIVGLWLIYFINFSMVTRLALLKHLPPPTDFYHSDKKESLPAFLSDTQLIKMLITSGIKGGDSTLSCRKCIWQSIYIIYMQVVYIKWLRCV